MQNIKPYIEEVSWASVRNTVLESDAEIAKAIDGINPKKTDHFIKVRYPFGTRMVKDGITRLPTENGQFLPITDARLPSWLGDQLSYLPVPIGIVTKNSGEVFREFEGRVFSINAAAKGLTLGIWEYFDWTTSLSVTAGARSLYMLPKISLAAGHKKLKSFYNVTLPPPRHCLDHWALFSQIVNSPEFPEPWDCEVVYLTKPWFEKLRAQNKSSAWEKLENTLLKRGWEHCAYARQKTIVDIIWQIFLKTLTSNGIRPSSYISDTLKHLILLGSGVLPGSAPVTGSNDLGPMDELQKAFLEVYGIKEYIPTIMQPKYLTEDQRPIYYSLQTPTLLESTQKINNSVSIIENIRELKELVDHFLNESFDLHLLTAKENMVHRISRLVFQFFHEGEYAYGKNIRPSKEIPKEDSNFLYMPDKLDGRKFSDTSPYLHGCIRVSLSKP